jgi:hypothetical protein
VPEVPGGDAWILADRCAADPVDEMEISVTLCPTERRRSGRALAKLRGVVVDGVGRGVLDDGRGDLLVADGRRFRRGVSGSVNRRVTRCRRSGDDLPSWCPGITQS